MGHVTVRWWAALLFVTWLLHDTSVNATAADPTVRITALPMYQASVPVETGYSITFVSSGYLDTEATAFQIDVAKIVRALIITNPQPAQLRSNPMVRYRHFINLFGVFVPSQEEGVSEEAKAIVKDTALQCTYAAVAPSEWRGRITCDKEATLGYGSVSPANALTSPDRTVVVAVVNSPFYGADHQGNAIFISNQYLTDNLLNTTVLVLQRLLAQVWFNLADEFDYGELLAQATQNQQTTSILTGGDGTTTSPLAKVPNCFDPTSPDGNPWSTAIFEQKLNPQLASMSFTQPYDSQLQLSDVPVAPCTFTDALKPSTSCLMQRSGTATTPQRGDPAAVDPADRKLLLWDTTPTASTILGPYDSVPHFCYVCLETMTRLFLTGYWSRSDTANLPSGLHRVAPYQLPRCPLPNEITVLAVSDSFWLFTNKHATWENGFETVWELLLDNTTVVLGSNVTQINVAGARVVEFTKRASNTIRLTTTDRFVGSMMGPTSFKGLSTRAITSATTLFALQIVTKVSSVSGVKVRICDSGELDFSGVTATNGNNYRYNSFCQGSEAACTYNYTVGDLSAIVGGFRISVPVAISLFAALALVIAPWAWLILRYNHRLTLVTDVKMGYMFVPLRRHVRILRWFVFATAATLVVIALSLWVTSLKLYVITQTITAVVLGIALGVAAMCNLFALLPAYGSLMRDWKPLIASSVLLLASAIALIVTAQLLLDTADDVSPDTALGSTLQSGWRSLVSTAPSTACSFEDQSSCSGWQYSCINQINSIDCPTNCAANLEQRTPCSKVVESLITSQLGAIINLLRGAGGVMVCSAVAFTVAAKGMYDLRHAAALEALSPYERRKRDERKRQQREDRQRRMEDFRNMFRLPEDGPKDADGDDAVARRDRPAYEVCLPKTALSEAQALMNPPKTLRNRDDDDGVMIRDGAWSELSSNAKSTGTLTGLMDVMDAVRRQDEVPLLGEEPYASPFRELLQSKPTLPVSHANRATWREWSTDQHGTLPSDYHRGGDLQSKLVTTGDGLRHRRPALAALLQDLHAGVASPPPAIVTSDMRAGWSPVGPASTPLAAVAGRDVVSGASPPTARRSIRWDDAAL